MKFNKLIFLFVLSFAVFSGSFAQGLLNQGAYIGIATGAQIIVSNGGYTNSSAGITDGTVDINGIMKIDGDFLNNSTNGGNVFINANTDGEVIFAKIGTQTIGGTGNFINFEKVTVNTGSITQIPNGKAATTNGVLTVNGDFQLLSPSNATASGSLITNSTVTGTGNVRVQRYFSTGGRYQYVSVPMANQSSMLFTQATAAFNPNFYTYTENIGGVDPINTNYSNWSSFGTAWGQVQATAGAGVTLNKAQSYVTYDAADKMVNFDTTNPADLYTGNTTVNLTYTDNDNLNGTGVYYDGWNMVGNPFPSALDWDNLTKTPHMDNTVYFWDGDGSATGNYVYYWTGSDDHLAGVSQIINNTGTSTAIPAMQSFVVHLTDVAINDDNSILSEILTLENTKRIHSQVSMYRNAQDVNFEYIKLKVNSGNLSDETLVRFVSNAQDTFEGEYDALKMFPNDQAIPMLYSLTNDIAYPLAINTLPTSSLGTSVPLALKTAGAGSYTISVSEMNFNPNTEVYLIDTKERKKIDLRSQNEYTFNFDGGDNRERFYLFSGLISDVPSYNNEQIETKIWAADNTVFIAMKTNQLVNAKAEITNMLGEKVFIQTINSTYTEMNTNLPAGSYLVRVTGKNGVSSIKKVFVQ